MGIDSMRVGGSRCPSLLVGGLFFACLLLICNWWTLSSENLELVRQIDALNEQIKISGEERDQCVTLRESLEQKYKRAEDEIASLHVRLEQEVEMKKKLDILVDSVSTCKNKLSSLNRADETKSETLKSLRIEKDNITITLEATRNENKKLQQEISKTKEECQEELDRVKLNCNAPDNKANHVEPSTKTTNSLNDTANQNEEQDFEGIENDTRGNDASNQGVEDNVEENDDAPPPESDRDRQMKDGNDYDKPEEPTN